MTTRTERVARAIERVEATIHQINNHWWNRRKRPEAEDLRILIDHARSLSSVSGEEI